MKRIGLFSLLILWFTNLFFIGMMIGQCFDGQEPGLRDGFFQNVTTIGKVRFLAGRFSYASKQVLYRIDDKWRDVIDNVIHQPKFSLITKSDILNEKDLDGEKGLKDLGVLGPGNEFAGKKPSSQTEVNLPFQIDEIIEEPTQKHVGGRPDPFLDIAVLKKAEKLKPIAKNNSEGETRTKKVTGTPEPKKTDPVIQPKELQVKINPAQKLRLRGVVMGETQYAYIENQDGYQKVAVGDWILGGRVTDITKQSVTIQIGDQQIVLTAEGLK